MGLKPAARPNFPPVPAHFLSSAQPEVSALTGGSILSVSFPAPRFSEPLTGGPCGQTHLLPLSASTSKRRRNHEANPTPNQPSPARLGPINTWALQPPSSSYQLIHREPTPPRIIPVDTVASSERVVSATATVDFVLYRPLALGVWGEVIG